ncbi:MAG: S-methyl-5-thioribose-1-phosphate isomerase [Planctomycetota bacterium]|jgi:methylthioribose-1-phosphate isomerase
MIVSALKWISDINGYLEIIDQRKLPAEFVKLQCRDIDSIFKAIKTLSVRGAPAIGVAAAYGLVLGLQKSSAENLQQALSLLGKNCRFLESSRPTAVNLSWALKRVENKARKYAEENPNADLVQLHELLLNEANNIYRQDVDMCREIGQNGQVLIRENSAILTHCNAGALATAGQGTALSILYQAKKAGKKFKVYADETRPLLQGARLTAWELSQTGIDVTVICDSTAGFLMKQKNIDAVITGADRIAANGDTANKIGTYCISVLAKEHNLPFYIAAPSSTFDMNIKNGSDIPIEQRDPSEVNSLNDKQTAPDGVKIYNPAFDITPAQNITAIITENGIIEQPNPRNIKLHFKAGQDY